MSSNKTTALDAAYKYGKSIVFFGLIGCCSGVTTIVDATTGLEKLEFLEYYPHITKDGVIVFEHFYPHFTDPTLVSDTIRALNLNEPVPADVPADSHNPEDDIGTVIYPRFSADSERHRIGSFFTVDAGGQEVFIVDRPTPSQEVCFVRVRLASVADPAKQQRCVSTVDLTGHPDNEVAVYAFSFNEEGSWSYQSTRDWPSTAYGYNTSILTHGG